MVRLYSTHLGGRKSAMLSGHGCPCFASAGLQEGGWDARFYFDGDPFLPGTQRQADVFFLSAEGADVMKRVGRFFLWEGRMIGEAEIID